MKSIIRGQRQFIKYTSVCSIVTILKETAAARAATEKVVSYNIQLQIKNIFNKNQCSMLCAARDGKFILSAVAHSADCWPLFPSGVCYSYFFLFGA